MISATNLASLNNSPIENPLFQPTNIEAFDARYKRLTKVECDLLKNCAALEDFLPKAIDFLRQHKEKNLNEDVAHYLMGQKSYLPTNFKASTKEISHNAKALLHDLLRTHRYGIVGKEESREHTITKLESLNTLLFSYDLKLNKWVNDAKTPEERKDRESAAGEIRKMGSDKTLSLKGRNLKSLPPLPKSLVKLELSCEIKSLQSLPQDMPNLQELKITNCGNLRSLEGMPQNFPQLKTLIIEKNDSLEFLKGMPKRLEIDHLVVAGNKKLSLTGMSAEMPQLQTLKLSENQLMSLEGLPKALPKLESLYAYNNKLSSLKGMPEALPNLKELFVGENKLLLLEGMPKALPNLTQLNVANNNLSSLEGMPEELPSLNLLTAENNELLSLKGLPSKLPEIRLLNFSKNKLTSLQDLPDPAQMPKLRNFNYSHNLLDNSANQPLLPLSFENHQKIETIKYDGNPFVQKQKIFAEIHSFNRGLNVSFMGGYNLQELNAMNYFLFNLHDCEKFSGYDHNTHRNKLLQVMKGMDESPEFRTYCAELISDLYKKPVREQIISDDASAIFDQMCLRLPNPEEKMLP